MVDEEFYQVIVEKELINPYIIILFYNIIFNL